MTKKKYLNDNSGKTLKTNKIDPRVAVFKANYLNSHNTKTFCNITQSAVAAGYSHSYGDNLSARTNKPKWWVEFQLQGDYMRAQMLETAQLRLNERLVEVVTDKDGRKLQADVAKFVSERLGKEHYSTRQELTGADGRRLFTNEKRVDATIPLTNLFKGVSASK